MESLRLYILNCKYKFLEKKEIKKSTHKRSNQEVSIRKYRQKWNQVDWYERLDVAARSLITSMVISTEGMVVPASGLNHFFVISTEERVVAALRLNHFL